METILGGGATPTAYFECATSSEEHLFNLFSLTTEPTHRAVEVMELDVSNAIDLHVPTPAIRLAIRSALTQTTVEVQSYNIN